MAATTRHTGRPWTSAVPLGRLALVAVLAAGFCGAQDSSLWEWKTGPFYSRGVLWDIKRLAEPNLRSFYQRMSRELEDYRFWTVGVFTDRDDGMREVSGKLKADELGYDWWVGLYNKFGRKVLPAAEVLGYQGNAVLRLRDSSGTCSEIVLAGDNFLRVHLGGLEFEILKTYYAPLPPHVEPSPGDEAMVFTYVRASSFPNTDQAREFSQLVLHRVQEKRVVVLFRTDDFFIDDNRFPIVYRFDPTTPPPSREQYRQSKTMYCFGDRPGILCRD